MSDGQEYDRVFDVQNPNWSTFVPEQNIYFVQAIQSQMNDLLRRRGYVTLNDVYDHLGFGLTEFGALAGWRGDVTIDFEPREVDHRAIELNFNINADNVFRD